MKFTNRTLWHSGLLFILLILTSFPQVVNSKVQIGFSDNGEVKVLKSGNSFFFDDLDVVEAVCQVNDNFNGGGQLKWLLNGNSIISKNVISDKNSIQLDKEIFSEPVNKLECFVTQNDLFKTSSYAFAYVVKNVTDYVDVGSISLTFNEGDSSMNEGARVSLQCKVKVRDESQTEQFPEFSWLKNAKLLDLATSQNFDVKVISGFEQHLVLDNVSVSDAGSYGCLVNGSLNLYDETSLAVKFAPILEDISNDEVSVNATENVDFDCKVSSTYPPVDLVTW